MQKSLKHVAVFFVLTMISTWILYFSILVFHLHAKEGPGMVLLIFGGLMPSLIGVLMALFTYNKDEKKEYFKRFYQVKRIGARWWGLIVLIFPSLHAITFLMAFLSGNELPAMNGAFSVIQNPISIIPVLLLGFFINGAWPEEWGWRGFALQPLLNRFEFVKANILLGILWAFWHLPLFLIPTMQHYQKDFYIGFAFFIAQSIGLSMIMAFVHIKTKQSILAAILLHMFYNLSLNMVDSFSQTYERIFDLLILITGVAISITVIKRKIKITDQSIEGASFSL